MRPLRPLRHARRRCARCRFPCSEPQPDGTLVKALARAWRWQKLLDEGLYTSISEIGDAENISKSYVSRILRLALLAPDIVEAVVEGRADHTLFLESLERPLPASWEAQRARILEPKTSLPVEPSGAGVPGQSLLRRQQHRVTGAVVVQ